MDKKLLLPLGVFFFALLSCGKQEADAPSTSEPVAHIPSQFTVQADEATKLYFDASDGYALKWTDDDRLLLSNGADWKSYFVKEGGDTRADLYITDGTDLSGSQFYAVFPYPGNNNPYTTSDNLYHLVIPTTQNYTAGGFDPAAFPMVGACGAVKALQFKNAGAVLAIKPVSSLPSSSKITSIIVSANEPLAGACTATWDGGEGVPSVTCTGSTSVTLNCGAGIDWGTTAYVCIAPGTYTDFCVEVVYTNSTGRAHYTWRKDLTVSRSTIKKLTVDFTDVVEYADLSSASCTGLASDETANCYLITDNRGGKYRFPYTVRGNGTTTSYGLSTKVSPSDVEELYVYFRTGVGDCESTIFFSEPELIGDYVCFELPEIAAGTPSTPSGQNTATPVDAGTALIAVSSNANWSSGRGMGALWSWMIWYNPVVKDHWISGSTAKKCLNVHLGARGTAWPMSNGYYYQWGRKDPFLPGNANLSSSSSFVDASTESGTLPNAVSNPNVMYGNGTSGLGDWAAGETIRYDWWNANQTAAGTTGLAVAKTMFDPCPPGYHVMSDSFMTSLLAVSIKKASGTSVGFGNGWLLTFPGSGSRRPNSTDWESMANCWTTLGLNSPNGGSASTLFAYTAKNDDDTPKTAPQTTTYYRAFGCPVRCEKE